MFCSMLHTANKERHPWKSSCQQKGTIHHTDFVAEGFSTLLKKTV